MSDEKLSRMEALIEARRLVDSLLAAKNEKGYPIHSASVKDRQEMELRYARFLLED